MSLTSGTTGRLGCGQSLALGYAYGLIGAVLAILVAAGSSFVLLLLAGSVVLGGGSAAAFLTRYTAAVGVRCGKMLSTPELPSTQGFVVLRRRLLERSGQVLTALTA